MEEQGPEERWFCMECQEHFFLPANLNPQASMPLHGAHTSVRPDPEPAIVDLTFDVDQDPDAARRAGVRGGCPVCGQERGGWTQNVVPVSMKLCGDHTFSAVAVLFCPDCGTHQFSVCA